MQKLSYKYIGSATQGKTERCRFLTPVFMREDKYYIQSIKDDKIEAFKQIIPPTRGWLTTPKIELCPSESTNAIYCFNLGKDSVIEGPRSEIETQLLPWLKEENLLNVHSRLIIANFLKLYEKQLELITLSNKELHALGISNKINIEMPFQNKKTDHIPEVAKAIVAKVEQFKETEQSINGVDVAYIRSNKIYFQNSEIKLDEVLNRTSALDETMDKTIGEIFNKAVEPNNSFVDIGAVAKNAAIYDYMLLSTNISIDQNAIESIMCSRQTNESILDIGLKIDNQFKPISQGEHFYASSFSSLQQSVTEIANLFLKTKQQNED